MHRRHLLQSALGLSAMAFGGCATAGTPDLSDDDILKAFYYAFPLYELARIEQDRTGAVGQAGRLNTTAPSCWITPRVR